MTRPIFRNIKRVVLGAELNARPMTLWKICISRFGISTPPLI
jgi:hypothetical protein